MDIFISMKKQKIITTIFITLVVFVCFLSGCARKKQSLSETIDDQTLQEAIEYGKSKAGLSIYEFMEPWSVYLGYEIGKGRAVYYTPFLQAAQLAKNAAEKKLKPDINIIKKVVSSKMDTINFLVTTYGDEPDISKRIKVYLMFNNTKIEPVYQHFPPFGEFNRDYYNQINGEVRFPAKNIPKNATVKLCLEISKKQEKEEIDHHGHHHESEITVGQVVPEHIHTEFTFDLSKYK